MRQSATGFTIIELLVAALIFLLVLAGMGSFLVGGLRFTETASLTAERLREVNDASGYLSDTIRRSAGLVGATGSNCVGDVDALSCISLAVPDAEAGSTSVEAYDGVQFRLVLRSFVPAAQRSNDAWADANTWAIVEYRSDDLVTCSGPPDPCTAPTPGTDVTGWTGPFLVLDQVSDASTFEAVGDSVQLALQVATSRRGTERVTPAVPQDIIVVPRNVD